MSGSQNFTYQWRKELRELGGVLQTEEMLVPTFFAVIGYEAQIDESWVE